jgi:hypothetical protein
MTALDNAQQHRCKSVAGVFFSEHSFSAQESLHAASSAATFTARVPKPQLRQEWVDIRVYFV